ncbi:MAG: helix-turn-helix domain-containing protein [Rhodothermales bacterium]
MRANDARVLDTAALDLSRAPARIHRRLAMAPAGFCLVATVCDVAGYADPTGRMALARLGESQLLDVIPSPALLLVLAVLGLFGWADRFRLRKRGQELARETPASPPPAKPESHAFLSDAAPRPATRDVLATARAKPAASAKTEHAPVLQVPQAKPVILVAVSDAFVRGELHHQLHTRYSVVEADDSIDVMELARSLQPALVITASNMDEKGACALCDEIKADPLLKHTPVLWIAPAAGLPNVEDLNISAEDTLSGVANNEALPIRVENLVEVRQYIQHGGLPSVKIDADDTAARLADTLFLENVHRLVDANIGNSLFGLEALAREAQVSLPHLESRLLRLTRLSAAGFLRTKRLQHAMELLEAGNTPAEVAHLTGFHSVSSFNRLFKQVVGVAPDSYTA